MTDGPKKRDKFAALRKQAEELLDKRGDKSKSRPRELKRLLYELQTHQIELEIQNEELREAQGELALSRDRFIDLYDFAPVGYLTTNEKGIILEANLTAADMLGIARNQLLSRPLSSFIEAEDHDTYYRQRRDLQAPGDRQVCELRMRRADDAVFHAQLESVVMPEAEERPRQMRIVLTDISRRKETEEQLKQAFKMQAVGTLAGGIAHEFNNVLSVIMGNADLAREEIPGSSRANGYLDNVIEASAQARDMVRQLLAFSRRSHRERTTVRLQSLLQESLKFVEGSLPSSVAVTLQMVDEPMTVFIDPAEMQQLVMNVCANAVAAMQEKGRLHIDLKPMRPTERESDSIGLPPGEYAALSFEDNGSGMDPATRSRIFDPFFTTKERSQGTGMGLAIVHGIVESWGGKIAVESKIGKGSTFTFFLPITNKPAAIAKRQVPDTVSGGNERILLVDDDKMVATVAEAMLSRLGYRVNMKTDSREALAIFKAFPDSYDLVITDQIMPELSGDELFKEIRAIRPGTPVILLTGFSMWMDREKAKDLGINGFANKPLQYDDLARLTRWVLDEAKKLKNA